MARPRNPDPPTHVHFTMKKSLRERLDKLLYREEEKRIPLGAYREFFEERTEEFLTWDVIDLHKYGFAEGEFVTAPKKTILKLEHLFNRSISRQA